MNLLSSGHILQQKDPLERFTENKCLLSATHGKKLKNIVPVVFHGYIIFLRRISSVKIRLSGMIRKYLLS